MTWLEIVQQRRIKAMKQSAINNLLSTMAAFTRFSTAGKKHSVAEKEESERPDTETVMTESLRAPNPPRNIRVKKSTSNSVALTWDPPDGAVEDIWYALSYKPRTPPSKNRKLKASESFILVDYIRKLDHEVFNLKSVTLYEFLLCAAVRDDLRSTPVRIEEYTEPSTVPVNLRLVTVGRDNALLIWDRPHRNKDKEVCGEKVESNRGVEIYRVMWSETTEDEDRSWPDANGEHVLKWSSEDTGTSRRCRLTGLIPTTLYIVCVAARHNTDVGITNISKRIPFQTLEDVLVEEEEVEESEAAQDLLF